VARTGSYLNFSRKSEKNIRAVSYFMCHNRKRRLVPHSALPMTLGWSGGESSDRKEITMGCGCGERSPGSLYQTDTLKATSLVQDTGVVCRSVRVPEFDFCPRLPFSGGRENPLWKYAGILKMEKQLICTGNGSPNL
jgi:hypothetical protein